jgi:RNA polymerase sigma-70 factor, ECF subfamily
MRSGVEPEAGAAERQQVAELYTAAREGVYRYLIALGLDAGQAQDIAQDAFLRLYEALRGGARVDEPRSWVYRVAHNMAMNGVKRWSRQSPFSEALAAAAASQEQNAEERIIERQRMERFRAALERLSLQQRLCLEMRSQGMRYREIAAVLQIKSSTVGEFIRRGVRELRKWKGSRE